MNAPKTDTSLLVCYSCGTLNRVPEARALSEGSCGKCGAELSTPDPVDLTGTLFERMTARDTGRFVVDIWAPWCGPCRMMAPSYSAAAGALQDSVRLFKLNSDAFPETTGKLGLRGVPTLMVWSGGKRTAVQSGAQTGPALTRWIETAAQAVPSP